MTLLARLKTPVLQNTGSVARDQLALERTFLAWIRTGLGFVALGIATERFSQLDIHTAIDELNNDRGRGSFPERHRRDEAMRDSAHILVIALLTTGMGTITYGTARYFSTLRIMQRGLYKPAYWGALSASVAVGALAAASITNMSQRERSKG